MAVRTPSPFDSPPVSPLSPRGPPRREILFESYLQKTPPLEKIFVVSIADIIVLACLYSHPPSNCSKIPTGSGNACRVNDFIIEVGKVLPAAQTPHCSVIAVSPGWGNSRTYIWLSLGAVVSTTAPLRSKGPMVSGAFVVLAVN